MAAHLNRYELNVKIFIFNYFIDVYGFTSALISNHSIGMLHTCKSQSMVKHEFTLSNKIVAYQFHGLNID